MERSIPISSGMTPESVREVEDQIKRSMTPPSTSINTEISGHNHFNFPYMDPQKRS